MTADSVLELISRALEQMAKGVSVSDIESQLSGIENASEGTRRAVGSALECARAMAEVRHQSHLHSALAESASDVITIVAPDGVIRYRSYGMSDAKEASLEDAVKKQIKLVAKPAN